MADGELRYYEHRFPLAPGSWSEGDAPEDVHARQHYELVHHSRGNAELNYRRFFAVTTLAGTRQEDPDVFAATHERIAGLVADGIAGLRVDHPDGLLDPADYLERLRTVAPAQWITVEKILEPGEQLPDWPVAGTTGYDAMREVDGVFVDPEAEPVFTELYIRLTGDQLTSAEHVEQGKRMVVSELLPAEVSRIAALAPDVPDAAAAVAEAGGGFRGLPLLPARTGSPISTGPCNWPSTAGPSWLDTLRALAPRLHDAGRRAGPPDAAAERRHHGQGGRGHRLLPVRPLHRPQRGRRRSGSLRHPGWPTSMPCRSSASDRHPEGMTSLSTHDTKRGEDVRARLGVLAELPEEWSAFAELFLSATGRSRAGRSATSWPRPWSAPVRSSEDRMHAYAEKAMREASAGTTWTRIRIPTSRRAVHAAVDAAYDDAGLRAAWDAAGRRDHARPAGRTRWAGSWSS